ncbi:ADP-ribosylglycohydrolase family protein [Methanosalsum zhilinae]|nr:ADP-ribosylglycohydrolase family protein [Methanosalsum zhilinae]
MKMETRYLGSLLGLATGDALGAPVESKPPGNFDPILDMTGGGSFNLNPGEWTDDTSQALCLAESLIEKMGFDQEDQLERYLKWYREGYLSSTGKCFGIGPTTSRSLELFEKERFSVAPVHDGMPTNGSLMRLAPVPLAFAEDPQKAIELSGKSSKTTHNSRIAIDACRYMGALITGALLGVRKEALLSSCYYPLREYWQKNPLCNEIRVIASGSFKIKEPPQIKGTMYVVNSLEAAMWAFYRSRSFEQGCLMAVNLGEDADTTGAIFGQLAGAYYGAGSIPERWLSRLVKRELIEYYAKQLLKIRDEVY